MKISIVLVQPARPGNVGAAARAMKTMGFTDLRIVDAPAIVEDQTARAFAHGSTEILAGARAFPTLSDAVADADVVVGTTGRRRGKRRDYYQPDDLQRMLAHGRRGERVAIVFGREESGLSNDELALCQMVSVVPMRDSYPSLNLGQAVMVFTYALSPLLLDAEQAHHKPSDPASVQALHRKLADLLPRLGFDPGRAVYHRMMERIGAAAQTDINLMHSIATAVEIHLPHLPRTDGRAASATEGPTESLPSSEPPR